MILAKKNHSNNPAAECSIAPRQSSTLCRLRRVARACFMDKGFLKTRPQGITRKVKEVWALNDRVGVLAKLTRFIALGLAIEPQLAICATTGKQKA